MIIQLDQVSRATIGRFSLKLGVSLVVAVFGKAGFIITAAGWLAIYAALTTVAALAFRERFPANCFTHWDEALWLIALSLGFRLAYRIMT